MRLQLHGRDCEAWAEHGRTDEDSMFIGGYWLDTEDKLTDEELDALTATHPDVLYDLWLDSQIDRAESVYDWLLDEVD